MTRYELSAVKHVYFIGCGGVASWLLPLTLKLMRVMEPTPVIHLVDGDRLENKNLDRQLFAPDQVGQFKSDALLALHRPHYDKLVTHPEFLAEGADWLEPNSLFFGCADNHPARKLILRAVDAQGGRAIIGGNEYTDSEAYIYEPQFKDTPLDPRVYYPELLTVTTGDPNRPVGCTGEVAVESPQLVLANFSAANHMAWLFWFHYIERPKLDLAETRPFWPIRHHNTFSRFGTELLGPKEKAKR